MRHNDYPATLLMEQPELEEASRYRMTPAASTLRNWSGGHWTITCTSAERARALRSEGSVSPYPISWLRLIEADAPAAEAVDYRWMRVRRVPLGQRGGLWHYKSSDETIISRVDDAEPMRDEDWKLSGLVRRALPNVKQGDPYNEAAYAGVAG